GAVHSIISRHYAITRLCPLYPESGHPICALMDKSAGLFQPRRGPASLARLRPPRPASGEHRSILAVLGFPLLSAHRLVRNGIISDHPIFADFARYVGDFRGT